MQDPIPSQTQGPPKPDYAPEVEAFLTRLDKHDIAVLYKMIRIIQGGTSFAKVSLFILGIPVAIWTGLEAVSKILRFKGFGP